MDYLPMCLFILENIFGDNTYILGSDNEYLFPLFPVGIQKGRVNIKKHELGFFDGIDYLAQFADDLIDELHQIYIVSMDAKTCSIISMDAKTCSIIGFKKVVDKFDCTNLKQEFFKNEKSCIGEQIACIKIYFNLVITFQAYSIKIFHCWSWSRQPVPIWTTGKRGCRYIWKGGLAVLLTRAESS